MRVRSSAKIAPELTISASTSLAWSIRASNPDAPASSRAGSTTTRHPPPGRNSRISRIPDDGGLYLFSASPPALPFPRSSGNEETFPQQIKLRSAEHLTLDQFQPVHLAFDLTIAPFGGQRRAHGSLVCL